MRKDHIRSMEQFRRSDYMKKLKKRLILVAFSICAMLALCACGETEEDGFSYNEDELILNTMSLFDKYEAVPSDLAKYYISDGEALEKSAVSGIEQARNNDKISKFEDFSDYVDGKKPLDKGGDYPKVEAESDYVLVTVLNHADKDVEVTVKYTENAEYYLKKAELEAENDIVSYRAQLEQLIPAYYQITVDEFLAQQGFKTFEELYEHDINGTLEQQGIKSFKAEEMVINVVYDNAQLIKQAGMNTLIGMGTVFCVLLFISFIISLMKFLPALLAKKPKIPAPAPAAPAAPAKTAQSAPATPAPAAVPDSMLMNDHQLVAVITAAIYAAEADKAGTTVNAISKDKLVVRSIRRVK